MPRPGPRRVLVIGGGAAGLVALRNLTQHGGCENVELVERKDDVGGVWYRELEVGARGRPRWLSPSYPGLIGNVLPEYLSFSYFPFSPRSSAVQPFPTLQETHAYLRAVAEPFLATGKIRLNMEIVRVEELEDGGWRVVMKNWSTVPAEPSPQVIEERWDGVVIATGREGVIWPDCEGVDEVRTAGIGKHAKDYRGLAGCEGKRIVVIGNANSSNDIAAQVVDVAKPPVYRSVRRPAIPRFVSLPDERIIDVAPVTRYTVHSTPDGRGKKATLHLKDGTEISDVDTVFFGTGYTLSYPFLYVLDPSTTENPKKLVPLVSEEEQPARIPALHHQILYAHNPSLAFIGCLMCLTPFIMSDLCSTFLALAWRGTLPYPDTVEERLIDDAERTELVRRRRAETDNPSNFIACQVLGDKEQSFAFGIRQEVVRVRPDLDGLFHAWTPEEVASRDAMYPRKLESLRLAKEARSYL